MRKKIVLGLITAIMLSCIPINVYAIGSAAIDFKSSSTVEIGDIIKVYMSIIDIKDADKGIIGVGGELIFDNEKLELIEAKTIDTPYDFWFNPKSNKLAGLDFTFENAINKDTKIYEFTFKAIGEGTSLITLDEAELSDTNTNILDVRVYGKEITIMKKTEPEKEEEQFEEIVNKEEVKKTNKEITKEIKRKTPNKDKLEKVNNVVHSLLKKITKLI